MLVSFSWDFVHYDPVHGSSIIFGLSCADFFHGVGVEAPELSDVCVGLVSVHDNSQCVCFFIFRIAIRATKIRVIFRIPSPIRSQKTIFILSL